MPDMMRMELLIKHGGIYMDMTTYLQEDIDWILNIARLPSHLIYNRFESLPKLLMSFSIYILLPPF